LRPRLSVRGRFSALFSRIGESGGSGVVAVDRPVAAQEPIDTFASNEQRSSNAKSVEFAPPNREADLVTCDP